MPAEKQLYIISGLGADERVFQKLDFEGYSVHFLHWLIPEKGETLKDYARRMAAQIPVPEPVIIGMSFGGIMATEISKQIEVGKIIIISSVKTRSELPPYFKIAGRLRFHRLIPIRLFTWPNPITNWLFGTEGKEENKLLAAVIKDTNLVYLKWAIEEILLWKNNSAAPDLVHIHGTNDRLLPYRHITDAISIDGGGHLMILNRAETVTSIINKILTEYYSTLR